MLPSGFRKPKDWKPEWTEGPPGMWSLKNAYEGKYEFFKGRPIPDPIDVENAEDKAEALRQILENLGMIAPKESDKE